MSSASDGFPPVLGRRFLLLALLLLGGGTWPGPLAAQTLAETAVAGTLSSALLLPSSLAAPAVGTTTPKSGIGAVNGTDTSLLLPGIAPVRVASPSGVSTPPHAPVTLVPAASGDAGVPPPALPTANSPTLGTQEGEAEDPTDILRRLRDPASGPLTISQLATLNDAVKRMEYLREIEKKIGEMNLGVSSAPSLGVARTPNNLPPSFAPVAPGSAGTSTASPVVLQVFGARGRYAAFVLYNGVQIRVETGDMIGDSLRVATVSLSGVRVMTSGGGLQTLPFVSMSGGGTGALPPGQMR